MSCKAWNTLSQINLGASSSPAVKADFRKQGGYAGDVSDVLNLSDIDLESLPRFTTTIGELDRVLGGGLVPGSVVLIGGNPGAGQEYPAAAGDVRARSLGQACAVCNRRRILAAGWHAGKAFAASRG
jgi:hypothetical protein